MRDYVAPRVLKYELLGPEETASRTSHIRGHLMARRLQAGTVWINTYRALTFNSPFGGFKNSGLGRLNGAEAIQNFLQTKSVWCELSSDVQDPFVMKS